MKRIAFKEKSSGRPHQMRLNDDGKWVQSDEHEIQSLWNKWVVAKGAIRHLDKDGYIVYGYAINLDEEDYEKTI